MNHMKTPAALITYCFVHEARPQDPNDSDSPKAFSCRLLFDKKKQKSELLKLKNQVQHFAKEKHGPGKVKLPFRDGDAELESGDQTEKIYEGKVFFNSKSPRKPGVVGPDNQPLEDPQEELYSGCVVKASVRPFAWKDNRGGKGVSLGLVNIKKLKDGPRLDGAISAEDDFEDDEFDDEDIPFETVEADDVDDEDDFFD